MDGDDLLAAMRDSILYLLRENRAERLAYPMDTAEVDELLARMGG